MPSGAVTNLSDLMLCVVTEHEREAPRTTKLRTNNGERGHYAALSSCGMGWPSEPSGANTAGYSTVSTLRQLRGMPRFFHALTVAMDSPNRSATCLVLPHFSMSSESFIARTIQLLSSCGQQLLFSTSQQLSRVTLWHSV